MAPSQQIVYAAAGQSLRVLSFDAETGTLEERGATTLRTDVHYAALHPSGRYLYAAASDRAQVNLLYVFGVAPSTGELSQLGDPFSTSSRAVHVSVDRAGRYLLTANNITESVDVLRLGPDGRIRELVVQPEMPTLGFLVHQIRVDPSNRRVFVPVRGNDGSREQIGRLHVFAFDEGVLAMLRTIDYETGIGPRHVDFHPTEPWMYVVMERGNQLFAYAHDEGMLKELFRTSTLRDPSLAFPEQRAGAIHVHSNGRWVYVTNRNVQGGENSIAAFEIDATTGRPTLLQHADSGGVEPRTCAVDPTGRSLIAANMMNVPNLSVFRIGSDGKLTFVRTHEEPYGRQLSWVGASDLTSSLRPAD